MVDVTTDGGRAVMIGIGVAGVALFLVARVIGLMIQRKGEQGHPQPPAQASPPIRGEFAVENLPSNQVISRKMAREKATVGCESEDVVESAGEGKGGLTVTIG